MNNPVLFSTIAAFQENENAASETDDECCGLYDPDEDCADTEQGWLSWKRRARDELPYNPELYASNVAEFAVPLDVVRECSEFYRTHIRSQLANRLVSVDDDALAHTSDNRCHRWSNDQFSFFVSDACVEGWS